MRTGTREHITAYPHVADFPAVVPLLVERLPTVAGVRGAFEGAGLRALAHEVVVQEVAPDLAAYADRLAAGADSILAALCPRALEAGLAAIRARAAGPRAGPVTEPIDVLAFRAPTGHAAGDSRG